MVNSVDEYAVQLLKEFDRKLLKLTSWSYLSSHDNGLRLSELFSTVSGEEGLPTLSYFFLFVFLKYAFIDALLLLCVVCAQSAPCNLTFFPIKDVFKNLPTGHWNPETLEPRVKHRDIGTSGHWNPSGQRPWWPELIMSSFVRWTLLVGGWTS